MRKLWIALASMGLVIAAGDGARAGDLVPGGWLRRTFMQVPQPPPVAPPAPPPETRESPPSRSAVHHPPVQHKRPVPPPRPASDGKVRF